MLENLRSGVTSTDSASVQTFKASMPASYLEAFSDGEIAQHYEVVQSRGKSPLEARIWRESMSDLALVCVVAEDRDELVADVAAVLASFAIVIESAQIRTRACANGTEEAVDLFWVRSAKRLERLDDHRLGACECALRALGKLGPGGQSTYSKVDVVPVGGKSEVTVRVLCQEPLLFLIKVEAIDRAGLLASVARILYREGLSIVSASVETGPDAIARDIFIGRAWRPNPRGNIMKAEVVERGLLHALNGIGGGLPNDCQS